MMSSGRVSVMARDGRPNFCGRPLPARTNFIIFDIINRFSYYSRVNLRHSVRALLISQDSTRFPPQRRKTTYRPPASGGQVCVVVANTCAPAKVRATQW
jgi:hypothetical protein